MTTARAFAVSGLLFDCDGVLVDSLTAAGHAWNEWAATWKPDFEFHRDVEHGRRLDDYVVELIGPEHAEQAIAELEELERRHAAEVRPIPGARELLAGLPPGSWAVATSGTREIATARLTSAGLPMPEVLVAAEDVSKGKPEPDPYLTAARRLGIPAQRCAVFEDAPAGVTAARRAGVRAVVGVGATSGGEADAVIADLRGVGFDGAELRLPDRR
ncbi:HAD-IA family hydrolase [Mycolicibacterium brumae]|uniref:Phosphatase n=1 Tax=Mycolicibacterium brumae TaxID=85968 RepID=A0A2G5P8F6_9MYCO|nr:HAD-IA family hydrolase [Mycolicibacterium brumae]MCV7193902.1 HAD-IA family hydrolase [Mycolicibacterium brumae]PIB74649.1 phosphatase [Mycolicibacterium brumae]RWA21819.1 hypothetical protein MBRU_14035 [Mycolicibacterium brumae DSM 44177]UWW08113.1 HAD-IA family hydrolase [Mycolicibacterium brumae]